MHTGGGKRGSFNLIRPQWHCVSFHSVGDTGEKGRHRLACHVILSAVTQLCKDTSRGPERRTSLFTLEGRNKLPLSQPSESRPKVLLSLRVCK